MLVNLDVEQKPAVVLTLGTLSGLTVFILKPYGETALKLEAITVKQMYVIDHPSGLPS